jgi:hypothetical protein
MISIWTSLLPAMAAVNGKAGTEIIPEKEL